MKLIVISKTSKSIILILTVLIWMVLMNLVGVTCSEDESTDPLTTSSTSSTDSGVTQNDPCELTETEVNMVITDALQAHCYDAIGEEITCPNEGSTFYGQDAQYSTTQPDYSLECNGTIVVDNHSGLMWEQAHHDTRVNYSTAEAYCEALDLGGYDDWRIPTIKELFSISEWHGSQHTDGAFYLDSSVFDFDYPDLESGDLTGTHTNQMMGQTWSSTSRPDTEKTPTDVKYFYNFLDAHIKSQSSENENATLFYRCVRGEEGAYDNQFIDNEDETITDQASGLMWQKANGEQTSGDYQFTWVEALDYCENLSLAGYDDWRLPDVKELHSIVEYDPPDWNTTKMVLDTQYFEFNLPAGKDLDTAPTTSPPDGTSIAPYFWSSTSHGDSTGFASYVCFGPCWAVEDQGFSHDVHGPGAQRSDPKDDRNGNLWSNLGDTHSIGDQLDVVQADNFVRCVR